MTDDLAHELDLAMTVALATKDEPAYRAAGGITMSSLGGCRRKGAYLRSGLPGDDRDRDHRAAEVGTALHRDLLPLIAEHFDAEYEVQTFYTHGAVSVPGTADLVGADFVADLKTVGGRSYAFATTVRRPWRYQVTAAALALDKPKCAVIVLDRDSGRARVFEWLAADYAAELDEWLTAVSVPLTDLTPARDFRGPAIDRECDFCPFSSNCWPGVAPALPQAGLIHDSPAVADALVSYVQAAAAAREAEKGRRYFAALLSGSDEGVYGSYQLRWQRSRPREELDPVEATRLLNELGVVVPVRLVAPRAPRIDVRPVG